MRKEKAIEILRMNEQAKWRSGVSVEEEKEAVNMAVEALEEQRPHGEWIREVVVEEPRKNKRAYARCSACGCRYNHYGVAVKHFDYCPKCGADNRPPKGGDS